ncbi:MAG: hypothetical protein SGJ23_08210 [Alphaproteobacteria bacterium]|nr:hypothetical protein [Alphaproteobacteria bacterium]
MSDDHGGHGAGSGIGIGASIAGTATALITAVTADILQPFGPIAIALTGVFGVVAVIAVLLSLLPPLTGLLRPLAGFAIVSAIVFGAFAGLQNFVAPKPSGPAKGFLATVLPPAADVQALALSALTPKADVVVAPAGVAAPTLSEAQKAMQDLATGIASPDPAERLRAGLNALDSEDDAVVAASVDKLYRTNDPALRQIAVKRLLSMRRGARMPLLAVAATEDAQSFANALQGVGLTIRSLNETSGAFDGGLCTPTGMAGTVNRTGVTISARCKIGADDRNTVLVLQPTDDFRLVGDARNDAGQSVRVELPLM